MTGPPRVIISGAGVAGLAAAVRLARLGWQPLIIERAADRRGGGYLINLAGAGVTVAGQLGILPALRRHHLDLRRFAYFSPGGRRRFTVGNAAVQALLGPDHLTLMRGELAAALHAAARDRADFRFGTRIRAVVQDHDRVQVTLDDGSAHEADLLIGADGLHSGVRDLVFADESTVRHDLGLVVAAFLPEQVSADLAEQTVATVAAPRHTAALVRLGTDRSTALLTYRCADPAGDVAGDPRAALSRRFDDLGWLLPDLPGQIRRTAELYVDTVSQISLSRWHSGRVVLLGDAAWCPSLFSGAGAALALTGADLLGTLIDRLPDLPAALTAWQRELAPLVERRQRAARRNAGHFAPASRLRIRLGQALIRFAELPVVTPLLRRRSGH